MKETLSEINKKIDIYSFFKSILGKTIFICFFCKIFNFDSLTEHSKNLNSMQ